MTTNILQTIPVTDFGFNHTGDIIVPDKVVNNIEEADELRIRMGLQHLQLSFPVRFPNTLRNCLTTETLYVILYDNAITYSLGCHNPNFPKIVSMNNGEKNIITK